MAKKATKTTAKKAAKKTAVKKATKTVATKKAPAKKAARKVAAKKVPTKKVAKKAPAKKPAKKAAKKLIQTNIIARVDVGFGNSLYIRGEGAGLNWDKGVLLENLSPYEWAFKTNKASTPIEFKFLINDELWAEGGNLTVAVGDTSISSPVFNW